MTMLGIISLIGVVVNNAIVLMDFARLLFRRSQRQLGLDEDQLLFGVYQGASLMTRAESEGRGTPMPNHILIFQDDIEEVCQNEDELIDEVRTTVLHEIGHHFGMDEDDLDELGYG